MMIPQLHTSVKGNVLTIMHGCKKIDDFVIQGKENLVISAPLLLT